MAELLQIEFIKTELRIGLTFSKLAMRAVQPDKISRNRAHAQAAYDNALRFFNSANKRDLAEENSAEIRHLIDELKANLARLGEAQ